MDKNEKAAFLNGFQDGMRRANDQERITCEVNRKMMSEDKDPPLKAVFVVIDLCSRVNVTADYDKVTVKDLDEFYSDRMNQIILVEWAMDYLRDKASGRKTEGQLLDALKAEQKDMHDCTKYPSLCKIGLPESQSSQ